VPPFFLLAWSTGGVPLLCCCCPCPCLGTGVPWLHLGLPWVRS